MLCRISAEEALSWGLVSRLVQPEQLLPEAQAIADKLARWVQLGGPGAAAEAAFELLQDTVHCALCMHCA